MMLYCPNCQNLISKTDDAHSEGTTVSVECRRCYKKIDFYIKYKPVGRITGSLFDGSSIDEKNRSRV